MRKIILMMLLAALSSSAMAEWVRIDNSATQSVYADPTATIHKNGDTVKMWSWHDFKTAQQQGNYKPYLSMKIHSEIDCKKKRTRGLVMISYSGNMGKGEYIRSSSEPAEWIEISPSSTGEFLWKYACGKK